MTELLISVWTEGAFVPPQCLSAMYRSDSDGMRPRPLLGMANIAKKPSLKRDGGDQGRQEREKRGSMAADRKKSQYMFEEESYDPDHDVPDEFVARDKRYQDKRTQEGKRGSYRQEPRSASQKKRDQPKGRGKVDTAREDSYDPDYNVSDEFLSPDKRSQVTSRGPPDSRGLERRESSHREPRSSRDSSQEHRSQTRRGSSQEPRITVKQEARRATEETYIQQAETARRSNNSVSQERQPRQTYSSNQAISDGSRSMTEDQEIRRRPPAEEQRRRDSSAESAGEIIVFPGNQGRDSFPLRETVSVDATRVSRPPKQEPKRKVTIKTDEEIFREEITKKSRYRDIPIPLLAKKQFRRSLGRQQSNVDPTTAPRSDNDGLAILTRKMVDVKAMIEPWNKALKSIEGTFGSGVASYFRLLRTLLYINVVVAVISFLFVILPTFMARMDKDISHLETFHISDIFLGTGYLKESVLFYGAYNLESSTFMWPDYDIPKGYFFTIGICYIIYLVIIMIDMVGAVKRSFIDSAEIEGKKFGPALFTSWEMTIEDRSSANQLNNKICMDFKKLLKHKKKKPVAVSAGRIIARTLLFALVLGVFALIGYGLSYILIHNSKNLKDYVWIVSFSVSLIIFLMPWLLRMLNRVEQYGSRHNLYLRLFQTVLFVCLTLGIIKGVNIGNTAESLGTCSETLFGQEMYRLIVNYFLIIVLLNFIVETIWAQISRQVESFQAPQFNISGNTTNLIYCQMVTCFGLYYSPVLPLITTVFLILTFYIQRLSLHINFKDSKKSWTSSTTRTIYLIITFLAVLVPFVFFGFSMVQTKSFCGPFKDYSRPADVTGYKSDDSYWSFWVFSRGVWGFIALTSVVFFYYSYSSANETKRLGATLRRELQGEIKELRVLQKAAAAVITKD